MNITTLFFDLDNTIYPPSCGLWEAISQRISEFMLKRLGIPQGRISSIRQYCRDNYCTTLSGLKSLYPVKEEEYLAFVHDINLSHYISLNPKLANMLSELPQSKYIFTNADHAHAQRILLSMGIEQYFNEIIDIYDMAPFSKPQSQSYQIALRKANQSSANNCAMIDDNAQNLEAAAQLGFFCIRVWEDDQKNKAFSSIDDILKLPSILPV